MKTITAILGSVLILCSFGLAQAQTQTQTKNEKKTLSQVVDSAVKRVEGDFIPAAEAMSEEKYGFAPTNGEFKGVRTFAEQIKHVAATNYVVASLILGMLFSWHGYDHYGQMVEYLRMNGIVPPASRK